jgi:DNA-directed RNA polymerase
MTWIDNIELYLLLKLENNSSRDSFGVSLLRQYPEAQNRLGEYAQITHSIICGNAETDGTVARCKLTTTSISIGSRIISTLKSSSIIDWKDAVRVGDLMIEAFYQQGYLTIVKPPYKSKKPVEIVLTEHFPSDIPEGAAKMSLHGVWSTKPNNINRLDQIIRFDNYSLRFVRPVIKRWDEQIDGPFKELLNTPAIKAVNKLQQVGWQVDKDVLKAVQSNPQRFYSETDKDMSNVSKKIDYQYTVTKATKLAEVDEFFFALDMDYRGRIYYVESYMNFQGSDLARGLLRFSERRYVTPEGLRWMKIHTACSFNESFSRNSIPDWCTADYQAHLDAEGLDDISVDKMTLRDRELWVDNNLELIYRTALTKTLHDCEKPVSFLSCCIELLNYKESGGHYFSNLPIPIDGSNNGWQHLGAISKDVRTGELVGLVPVGIQNDFYVQTAKKLIEITKDPERKAILNTMPMKKIRKGISKRGSMTRAYSAGAQKIAENMYNDCKQAGYVKQYGITEVHCKGFARDLVKAIEEVCSGPLKTMKFLQRLAQSKIESGYGFIKWTTPSGFPVIYVCNHFRSEKQRGTISGIGQINHVAKVQTDAPDIRGFMCGISPNYIHSQDASHMSLVINGFDGAFGAVHDSFSTHADMVDELCRLTKNVFVEMYDEPNYFDVIESRLEARSEQPALGNLDINDVKKSDYFFA